MLTTTPLLPGLPGMKWFGRQRNPAEVWLSREGEWVGEWVSEWESLGKTKNKSLSQFSYNCVDIWKLSDSLFKVTLLPIKLQKTKSFGIHEEEFINSIRVNFKNAAICWMLITEPCKKGAKIKKKKKIRAVFYFVFFISDWLYYFSRCSANQCNPKLISQMTFLWVQSPYLSLQLAHSAAKEHTWLSRKACQEGEKTEVGVGAPSTKLKYAFVM